MPDYKTLKFLTALLSVVFVSGCKKSPFDYFDQIFSAQKLSTKKAKIHGVESAADEEVNEGYRDPITGQQIGVKEESEKVLADQQANFAPLCSALVKSIRNEPWFYNFQSNIKKAQEKNEHGELIRSHMAFRRMISREQTYTPEIFSRCGEAVLTIQSFPELRKLKALSPEARSEELSQRLTH